MLVKKLRNKRPDPVTHRHLAGKMPMQDKGLLPLVPFLHGLLSACPVDEGDAAREHELAAEVEGSDGRFQLADDGAVVSS